MMPRTWVLGAGCVLHITTHHWDGFAGGISPILENQANFHQHTSFVLEKLPPPQTSQLLNTAAAFFMVNGLFVQIPSSVQRFQETPAATREACSVLEGLGATADSFLVRLQMAESVPSAGFQFLDPHSAALVRRETWHSLQRDFVSVCC